MVIKEATQEEQLAAAAIRGDDDAFCAIYELLSLRVFNLVLRSVHERATAEDICQEIWLKAHREIRSLQSPGALRTWLFRMASRACIDYSRSRVCRERGSPEVTEEMLEAPTDEPERVAERKGELRVMWEALASMPPRQSMALYLKQVEGCSYDQIGRVLNCPKSAVETLLFRARQGFARSHRQLRDDPKSSCKLISQTMAVVIDNEGTQFQQRALEAHVNECRPCRIQMQTMAKTAAGYSWLPMLPVGQQALMSALATGIGGAGVGAGIGRLIGALLLQAKTAGTVAVVIGALGTTAAAAGAAAGMTPSPGEVVTFVQDSVTSGPDTAIDKGQDEPRGAQDASGAGNGPGGHAVSGNGDKPTVETSGGLPPAGGIDPRGGVGVLGDGLSGPLGGVTDTVNTTLEGVTNLANNTLNGATDTLNGVLGGATETLDGVVGGVNDALGGAVDGVLPGDQDAPVELPPIEVPPVEIPPIVIPPIELPPILPTQEPGDDGPPCIPLPLLPC